MGIERIDEGKGGAFIVGEGGKRVAELTYSLVGEVATIEHTEVDKSLRGTGTGQKLVEAAVEWARKEHKKIALVCPFAKSVFDKRPELKDVLS